MKAMIFVFNRTPRVPWLMFCKLQVVIEMVCVAA